MISLSKYDEFGPGMGFPSIKESFSKVPYPNKDIIVNYLKNGKVGISAGSVVRDIITDEKIANYKTIMSDGKYSWNNSIAYYVENYNLRLPREFEEHVLSKI